MFNREVQALLCFHCGERYCLFVFVLLFNFYVKFTSMSKLFIYLLLFLSLLL